MFCLDEPDFPLGLGIVGAACHVIYCILYEFFEIQLHVYSIFQIYV